MKANVLAVALVAGITHAVAGVGTYPAPPGEVLSEDYEVSVAGRNVDVYTARVLDPPFAGKGYDYGGDYSFANFDVAGSVEVRVNSKRSLRAAVVRPAGARVRVRVVDEHTLRLTLPGPRKISLEPDGKRGPLLLFANPRAPAPPRLDTPGLIYFGPGMHKPDRILLTNNETLYLAGGAVVKGGIIAQGQNLCICGRGILDGSDWPWGKGPTSAAIAIRGTNVEVSGITIRGSFGWTIVPRDSRGVTIRDVKICGGRVQNDDGIDVCNSQDVRVSDCFVRTDDDCVALKGLEFTAPDSNVEHVTVEHCVLWCDRARIFLLGHESRAAFMRGITLRDLDIVHFAATPFLFEPGEEMQLADVTVEDVRVHGEGQAELVRLHPTVNQYMRNQVPGTIRDVCIRSLAVSGAPGDYRLRLLGADARHDVRGVTFSNISILGAGLDAASTHIQTNQFASELRFDPR